MANDFKFEPVFIKKPFPLENERKKSLDNEFKNVEVLFDNISGEKYTVKKTSNVYSNSKTISHQEH